MGGIPLSNPGTQKAQAGGSLELKAKRSWNRVSSKIVRAIQRDLDLTKKKENQSDLCPLLAPFIFLMSLTVLLHSVTCYC